ncbi:hypothetical protein HNW13_017905 [Shewanella sp. BF02_Schw]|uniref:hypothetical protein n=1 Tax=Shewanella sp. BF02_Schw TaxID=394908 RepID=UPI0017844D83|nr:hypothetical protein [Shewanella sp. BF02_Schw]MBO1897614.1 hypothetical protein [Shewanella sp. BF02_Schw]
MMLERYADVLAQCNAIITEQFQDVEIFVPQFMSFASSIADDFKRNYIKNPSAASKFRMLNDINSNEPISLYLDQKNFEDSSIAKLMSYEDFTDLCVKYFCFSEIESKQPTIQLHKQIDSAGHSFSLHFNWQGCEVEFNADAETDEHNALQFDSSFVMAKIYHQKNSFSQLLPPTDIKAPIVGVSSGFIDSFGFKQNITTQARGEFHHNSIEDRIRGYQTLGAMKHLLNNYFNASFINEADDFAPMIPLIGSYIAKYQTERCKLIDLEFVNADYTGTVDNWIELFKKIETLGSAVYQPAMYEHSDFKPNENDLNTFKKHMYRMALSKGNDLINPIALYALTMAIDVKSLYSEASSTVARSLAKYDLDIDEVRNSIELANTIDIAVEGLTFRFREDIATLNDNLDRSL